MKSDMPGLIEITLFTLLSMGTVVAIGWLAAWIAS
jgi:hypothetical protein